MGFGGMLPRSLLSTPLLENGESRDQILLQLEPDVPGCKGNKFNNYIIMISLTIIVAKLMSDA